MPIVVITTSCVELSHLFLANAARIHIADATKKKRMRRGERHHKTTLTEATDAYCEIKS